MQFTYAAILGLLAASVAAEPEAEPVARRRTRTRTRTSTASVSTTTASLLLPSGYLDDPTASLIGQNSCTATYVVEGYIFDSDATITVTQGPAGAQATGTGEILRGSQSCQLQGTTSASCVYAYSATDDQGSKNAQSTKTFGSADFRNAFVQIPITALSSGALKGCPVPNSVNAANGARQAVVKTIFKVAVVPAAVAAML